MAGRLRARAKSMWYGLVIVLVIQTLIGVIVAVSLKHQGEEAANRAARTQAQAICPLVQVLLDSYTTIEKAGKLTDAVKVVRDRMQGYADRIGCPHPAVR